MVESIPTTLRRVHYGAQCHHRPPAFQNGLGCPAATRRDPRRLSRGGLHLVARPPVESGHHCAVVSVADPPWQYRLSASASSIWPALQRLGLLSSPVQTPLADPRTPLRALGALGPACSLRGRSLAWPSPLLCRWLGLLHARYARFAGGVRSASGTTARLWLSRCASAGPVSCWDRPPHPSSWWHSSTHTIWPACARCIPPCRTRRPRLMRAVSQRCMLPNAGDCRLKQLRTWATVSISSGGAFVGVLRPVHGQPASTPTTICVPR